MADLPGVNSVKSARRYYLLKRFFAFDAQLFELASVWRSKQEAAPGTDLPDAFPSLSTLTAAGYSTVEDIDGATLDEFGQRAGLNARDAGAVLVALAPLLP